MVMLIIKIIGVVLPLLLMMMMMMMMMMIVVDIIIVYDYGTNKNDIYHCC